MQIFKIAFYCSEGGFIMQTKVAKWGNSLGVRIS